MKAHLTERSVKGLEPGPKNIIVYDEEVVGFSVRITSGGTRAFILTYLIAAWVTDYNTARPHSALGYQTPAGFALHLTTAIARPAARDEGSARRAIAQHTPKGVNQQPAPVAAG